MRQVGKIVVTALVLTLAQGCAEKKAKVKVAPQAQAPATEQAGALYPPPFPEKTETPPVVPEPTKPDVVPAPNPAPQKKQSTHKKSKSSSSATAKTPKPSAAKPAVPPPTQPPPRLLIRPLHRLPARSRQPTSSQRQFRLSVSFPVVRVGQAHRNATRHPT